MAEETLSFLQKIRDIPFIKAYRQKHQRDLKAYRERKFNEPAVLDKEYTKKLDTIVVGISPDSPESHAKFMEKKHLKVILLSDQFQSSLDGAFL